MSENSQASSDNERIKTQRGPRKRQVHNEVERRRKDKINSWIVIISELLPNKELHKRSKISILEQTVSYIKELVAERTKLLLNHSTDVQAQEIKSLRRNVKLLEEKNLVYSSLLREANINLTALPKKASKYSNKFTEEHRLKLLGSLNAEEQIHSSGESTANIPIASEANLTQVQSCFKDSQNGNNFAQSISIANNVPVVTLNISTSECSQGLVAITTSAKAPPILNIPCRIGATTMLSAGGVTSALPPLPVMSSTLGPSLSGIHNKSMQLIILPNGAGILQPSIMPSNISLVGPTLEPSFSILMAPQPPTMPLSTIAISTKSKTISSNIDSCNITAKTSEVVIEAKQNTVSSDVIVTSAEVKTSSSSNSISQDNVPSVSSSEEIQTSECENGTIKESTSTKGNKHPHSPSSIHQEVRSEKINQKEMIRKEKQIVNRPLSLQVLSANKIILLASKFQMPCKNSTSAHYNNEKDVEFSSVAGKNGEEAKDQSMQKNNSSATDGLVVSVTRRSLEDVSINDSNVCTSTEFKNYSEPVTVSNSVISAVDENTATDVSLATASPEVASLSDKIDRSTIDVASNHTTEVHALRSEHTSNMETNIKSSETSKSVSLLRESSIDISQPASIDTSQSSQFLSTSTNTNHNLPNSVARNSCLPNLNLIPNEETGSTVDKCENVIPVSSVFSPITPESLSDSRSTKSNAELPPKTLSNTLNFPSPAKTAASLPVQTAIQSTSWENHAISSLSVNNIAVSSCESNVVKEPCFYNSSLNHQQLVQQSNMIPNFQCTRIHKDKTPPESTGNKVKLNKRNKAMPETLPESIPINSFPDYTFDVLNPVGDLVPQSKFNESSIATHQKTNSINSTSDILAKAAESIFGNDAFNSMEVVSAQTLAQQIEMSDSFTRNTVQFANTGMEIHPPPLVSNALDRNFTDNAATDIAIAGHYISSLNTSKYDPSSRVRKNNDNGGEPPAKKLKEQHNLIPSNIQKVNCLARDPLLTSITNNGLSVEKSDFYHVSTNSIANSVPSSNGISQMLTAVSAKQSQFCTATNTSPQVCTSSTFQCQNKRNVKGSGSTGMTSVVQQNLQPISANSCSTISHTINSLFNNTCNTNEINAAKNAFVLHVDKSDNGKTIIEHQKHVCPCPNQTSGNKKAISSSSVSKDCITTKPIQNEIISDLNNSTSMQILPSDNRAFFGVQHLNNNNIMQTLGGQTTSYSSLSTTLSAITPSKFSTVSISSISDQTNIHATLPPLLSRDPNSRIPAPFGTNSPIISSASIVDTSKNCQLLPSSNSLSHSLCSLLKEPSPNVVFANAVSVPNSINADSMNTIAKSKYSALSLISNACSETSYTKGCNPSITSIASAPLGQDSSNCRSQKSSLSYSAERLIQSQYTSQEKDRCKTISGNYSNPKKINCAPNMVELYKNNSFAPVSCDMSVSLPLPPVTSFPSFPSTFPMCDGRPSSSICNNGLLPYQEATTTIAKENIFPQNSIIPNAQNSSGLTQSSSSFTKSSHNVPFNVENHGNMYNSCNFLQHTKSNLDIMKVSDSSSCFPPLFVNSGYPQQVQKQNYCPFIEQSTADNVEKGFTIIPPPLPSFHSEKDVAPDHRTPLMSNMPQPSSNYLGNMFYDTASCSHESAPVNNKPSIVRSTQDSYMPLRNKQNGQAVNQHKPLPSSKGKTKKSKHSTSVENNFYKINTTFNPNASMNFNVFTVPDLSSSKTNAPHNSNHISKTNAQATLPILRDSTSQQTKLGESVLGSVMHPAFNPGLHQQNEGFLNLNFQPPPWNSDGSLTVPPPLTLPSPCTSASKVTRSFSAGVHPVPNFNLSNILPDMGTSSSSELNTSPLKFQTSMPQGSLQDCHSSSVPSNSVVSVPHQTALYAPHPSVVSNALLNPSLNRNQSAMAASGNIPPIPHTTPFSPTQTPPFRNVIHSLNFSRN